MSRPFLGTDLTVAGAVITVAVAPAFWTLLALVWAALPA